MKKPHSIKRYVITGGPCGGKSTGMSRLRERLENLGYAVYTAPEAATLLILAGADPRTMNLGEFIEFQTGVMRLQHTIEEILIKQAKASGKEKVILLLDRGIFDGAVYTPKDMWGLVLKKNGLTPIDRDERYDLVIHMTTAAKGAPWAYTLENNKARRESLEEAIANDDLLIEAWTGHPHLRIINNSTDFETKIQRVLKEITNALGEPEPIETERKFLVEVCTQTLKESGIPQHTAQIVQHYLPAAEGTELRVRRRGSQTGWVHTRTVKRPKGGASRYEEEEMIDPGEYWLLLQNHPDAPVMTKDRTCIVFEDTYFELDQIHRHSLFLMEVETDEEGDITPPPGIRIIREVTGEKEFSNKFLAN